MRVSDLGVILHLINFRIRGMDLNVDMGAGIQPIKLYYDI